MKSTAWRAWLSGIGLLTLGAVPTWGQTATPTATVTSTFLPARTPTPEMASGRRYWTEQGRFAEILTAADTWADVGTWPVSAFKTRQFGFAATRNTLDVQILCSLDGGTTYPITDTASFQVTTSAVVAKTSTAVCSHLKVQTKPNGAGANGTLQVEYMGASY